METQPAAEPIDLTKLSDKGLIERYCGNPPDQEAFAELWKRYERTIRKYVAYFKSLCPDSYNPAIFAEDTFSDTQAKIVEELATYEGRASLSTWIYRIIGRAALDVRRKITGRNTQRLRTFVDFDSLTETEIVNTYAILRDKVKEHPFPQTMAEERKVLLREVLLLHARSPEGHDSLRAVLLHAIDECTIAAIARRFFTYHRKIDEMLAHDYLLIKDSLAEIGITKVQDLLL